MPVRHDRGSHPSSQGEVSASEPPEDMMRINPNLVRDQWSKFCQTHNLVRLDRGGEAQSRSLTCLRLYSSCEAQSVQCLNGSVAEPPIPLKTWTEVPSAGHAGARFLTHVLSQVNLWRGTNYFRRRVQRFLAFAIFFVPRFSSVLASMPTTHAWTAHSSWAFHIPIMNRSAVVITFSLLTYT